MLKPLHFHLEMIDGKAMEEVWEWDVGTSLLLESSELEFQREAELPAFQVGLSLLQKTESTIGFSF